MSNQQPLSNFEVRELCFALAGKLQTPNYSHSVEEESIKLAITARVIESKLEDYILIPKYKHNGQESDQGSN